MISDKTKKAIEELDRIIKDPATKDAMSNSYDDVPNEFTTAQAALARGETAKALESFKSLVRDVQCKGSPAREDGVTRAKREERNRSGSDTRMEPRVTWRRSSLPWA